MATMKAEPMKNLSFLFFVSIFLDMFSVALVVPLLHLYVEHLDIPKSIHGIYQAIYGAMQIISTPLLGTLSDHVGRRPVLVLSLAGTSVAYFILLYAVSAKSAFFFIASRVLIGGIRQSMSTGAALVAERYAAGAELLKKKDDDVDEDSAQKLREQLTAQGLSKFQSAASFGFVVGPGIGGYLADEMGIFTVTAIAASINVVNSFMMYKTAAPLPEDEAEKKKKESKKKEDAKPTRSNPVVLVYNLLTSGGPFASLLAGMYFFSLSRTLVQSSLALLLKDAFDLPTKYAGLVISASMGLSAAVQAVVLPQLLKHFDTKSIVNVSMWAAAIGYFSQTFSTGAVGFCVSLLTVSCFSGVADTLNKSRFASHFASSRGGEVMSIVYSIDGCNRVVGPLLGSFLMHQFADIALIPVAASCVAALLSAMLVSFVSV